MMGLLTCNTYQFMSEHELDGDVKAVSYLQLGLEGEWAGIEVGEGSFEEGGFFWPISIGIASKYEHLDEVSGIRKLYKT